MSDVIFFIAAIGTIAGAIGVIALAKPFYSVLALAAHLVLLAALFLLLRAEFVAFAQVVVYAGAVMVLYVFVVQYVGDEAQPLGQSPSRARDARRVRLRRSRSSSSCSSPCSARGCRRSVTRARRTYTAGFGTPEQIGTLLLTKFLAPFEIASYLLLVAAVGAVAARAPPRAASARASRTRARSA